MKKFIKNQKPEVLLFTFSLLFLILLGVFLSYNFDFKENYNLLFDSDTARVIKDATEVAADHYRADVHPLFILWIQPVVFLLTGIVCNKTLALIIISSFVSALSVFYIYKILDAISSNKKRNIIFSLIYLFSFSNIIFTTGIETYNFAALFLIMMWYYFIKQEGKSLNGYSYVLLVLFGILTFSFTITNVCIYLIMIITLWIQKKINIKKIAILGVVTLTLVIGLNLTQKIVWRNAPVLWNLSMSNEQNYVREESFGKNNIKEVLVNDYYNSWISSNVHMELSYGNYYNGQNYFITFNDVNSINFILISSFYILLILLVARNFKKNKVINSVLLAALGFNTVLHLFYGNNSTFLYSLHFLYIILLLFGINYHKEENKKWKSFTNIFLYIFLLGEILINSTIFIKVLRYVKDVLNSNYLVANLGFIPTMLLEFAILVFVTILVILFMVLIKKLKTTKQKEIKILELMGITGIIYVIIWTFIGLNSIQDFHKFLWIKLSEKTGEIVAKEKLDYVGENFKKQFKTELKELDKYKEEIKQLKEEYNTVYVKDTGWTDYYYFGMANRRKLVYRPNKLIDIETKEVIKSFEEKNHYIIPNTYTVLIETTDEDYIMIKEDKDGVHYIVNGEDEMIKDTNELLDLYRFQNQKYPNIKKALYGEILFNIKDSTIYPNIIVYEKPWYRDAAITSMVLKKTNNTDLIKEWVMSISDIYDKQNGGVEEPDNLGELLFLLSTQEEKNEALIDQIEEEAEHLANTNPAGYYIFGKTDFGDQHLYQNLWYKLGIESVGRSYHFNMDSIPEDSYSKMAWWSDYEVKNKVNNPFSSEYPYLSYAERHKLGTGEIALNENLYPLSWEFVASQAKYGNYVGIDEYMANAKVSPLHSWSASEFLLLLLDE